jgi:hypothetical protein
MSHPQTVRWFTSSTVRIATAQTQRERTLVVRCKQVLGRLEGFLRANCFFVHLVHVGRCVCFSDDGLFAGFKRVDWCRRQLLHWFRNRRTNQCIYTRTLTRRLGPSSSPLQPPQLKKSSPHRGTIFDLKVRHVASHAHL